MTERDDDESILAPFARALREETEGADRATVERTRERVVASARPRVNRSRFMFALAMAAIVLGTSTVWAMWTGFLPWAADDDGAPAPQETDRVAATERSHAAVPQEQPAPEEQEPPIPPAEPAEEETRVSEVTAPRETPAPSDVAGEIEPPVDPRERRAYDDADRLHFAARDWPAAVRAWDVYLASFPGGRFVPEARWNRAIALVRAGRTDEARQALGLIAGGSLGGYRQREAAAVIEALER